jgi:uncharacterized protein (DUF1330 family)
MPVFFLAEIEVFDHEQYQAYIERASHIVRQYGGEYIFRSDHIVPVSGNWSPRRLVLIRFNSKTDIQLCFGSKEYLQIKHLREQSTKSRSVIIDQDVDAKGGLGPR